jgi:hypothetical protein
VLRPDSIILQPLCGGDKYKNVAESLTLTLKFQIKRSYFSAYIIFYLSQGQILQQELSITTGSFSCKMILKFPIQVKQKWEWFSDCVSKEEIVNGVLFYNVRIIEPIHKKKTVSAAEDYKWWKT